MPSGRLRHDPTDRRQTSVLADLVAIADQLLTREITFADAAPRLVRLLGHLPGVRVAEMVPADDPGRPVTRIQAPTPRGPEAVAVERMTLTDPVGASAVSIQFADSIGTDDALLLNTILGLLNDVCSGRGGPPVYPRPGV